MLSFLFDSINLNIVKFAVELVKQSEVVEKNESALMNENFYSLLPIILVLIFIIIIIIILVSKNYPQATQSFLIRIKVLFGSEASKVTDNEALDKIIEDSGYEYDSKQDIFYSHMYAWQRSVGYCLLYDQAAAPLGMIIDCEPIYFEYDSKRWMIEFWKGQYDLTTGCEIGLYRAEGPDVSIPGIFIGTFYECAEDEELLHMSFSLKKNNRTLFTRKGKHWWLTGFKVGEFSEPEDLSMDINITLKDKVMRDEFVKGLKNASYFDDEITKKGNTVSLQFNKPHVLQPFTRTEKTDWIIQRKNEQLCDKYKLVTKDYTNTPDKIKAIEKLAPELYEKILSIGKNRKLFEIYTTIKNYLV